MQTTFNMARNLITLYRIFKFYGERVVDTIFQKITYQALFCQY